MKEIWIVSTLHHGKVNSSCLEILGKVEQLYSGLKDEYRIEAVVLSGDEGTIADLEISGADGILEVTDPGLAQYNPAVTAAVLTKLIQDRKPEAVFMAADEQGSEVAPTVAASLHAGLVAHATQIELDDDHVLHLIGPAFGGKLYGENIIPNAKPVMATIKPGVFLKVENQDKKAEVEKVSVGIPEEKQLGVELVETEEIRKTSVALENEPVLICVGLGCAMSGNFEKAEKLAEKVHAGICATRPVCDLGYLSEEEYMVGTSGHVVHPKLYIGLGISGAAQHSGGITSSNTIININTDSNAESMKMSDGKITADCGEVLDALLSEAE